jgi:hypothetical protein
MATYFHGTTTALLPQIMRRGLDPGKMHPGWRRDEWEHAVQRAEEEGWPTDRDSLKLKDQPRYIYLGSDFMTARGWVGDRPDAVVLEVTPPPELEAKFVTDLGEFVRVPVVISPQYLRVLSKDEERKLGWQGA